MFVEPAASVEAAVADSLAEYGPPANGRHSQGAIRAGGSWASRDCTYGPLLLPGEG